MMDKQEQSKEGDCIHYRTQKEQSHLMEVCEICNKVFSNIEALELHYLTHIGVQTYDCHLCNETFLGESLLKNHISSHDLSSGQFRCQICSELCKTRHMLEVHLLKHSDRKSFSSDKNSQASTSLKTPCVRGKPFSCDMCGRNFSQERHLHNHMSTHTKVFPFKCQFCEKLYERKGNLEKHMKVQHRYEVEQLPDGLQTKAEVKCNEDTEHIPSTLNPDVNEPKDDRKSSPYDELKVNGKVEYNVDNEHIPYDDSETYASIHKKKHFSACQFCEKVFARKGNLVKHVRIKHKDDIEPVQRKQDEYKQLAFNLNTKMDVKHEEYSLPFFCSVCEKDFISEHELKLHNFRHTGIRTYNCNICNEVFLKEVTLTRHVIKHVNEKNNEKFECNRCFKKFQTNKHLEVHLLIHNKPFSCHYCSKTFAQRGNLQCHLLIHTGEKPYICEICGKGFRQRGNLQNHIFVHTEKKPFKCEFCPLRFAQKGNLKVHLKRIHPSNGIELQ